jgi:hypothetical protein
LFCGLRTDSQPALHQSFRREAINVREHSLLKLLHDCRSWPTLVRHSKRFLLPGKGGMRQDDRHVEKIDRHVLEIKSGSNI